MKKIIVIFTLLLLPLSVGASFDNNLYYGLQNNNEVKEMQEFLTEQKVYDGPITGNFYSLTLKAVKDFQKKENISPASGFFGPLTRTKANEILSANVEPSNQQAVQETGSVPPTPTPAKTNNDVVKSLQDQIALLLQQIQSLQAQQTTLNQIQQNTQQTAQNTQQIVQNTTPSVCTPNWQCNSWNTCANSQQTRTCTDLNNCGTTTGRPVLTQSCTVACTPNWQCGNWSTCTNSQQTRNCYDSNYCGITTGAPAQTQSCVVACTPNWQCGNWGTCASFQQNRTCIDANVCGATTGKPNEMQSCISSYSLNITIDKVSNAELGEVYWYQVPKTIHLTGAWSEGSSLLETGARINAPEYVPTSFEIKKFTVKLIGTATTQDFDNANWRGKYFYKLDDKTLVWEHSLPFSVPSSGIAFDIGIAGIKNSGVSLQLQIDENSLYIVDGNGKQVKMNGNFPIKSRIVNVEP